MAQTTPSAEAHLKDLTRLVEKAGEERFEAEFIKAVKDTDFKLRASESGPPPRRSS
ncbi:hypothetical protein POF50_030020 [Streptomyces sp. SL13]|uniref:Uncharacterized protein n=1 Tax=Streptantibioticus silvisoli TaxID=2705255 RepID=A0AA90KJF0_9ACTN|nr:hypothetical protein [Streptantibioticus silvisoli]MDI5973529.1 hypothetical protein [Streptantibioticus silvisoli]